MARGIVELGKAATVKRTKNMRDGFEYVIRIDAPNSVSGSGATAAGSKRWTKLVMVLRSEPEMMAWIEAIRWCLSATAAAAEDPAAASAEDPATALM